MTDPRLHSTKPIDDEVPFADATEVARDPDVPDDPALVTPAAAERDRVTLDRGVHESADRGREHHVDQSSGR